MKIKTILLTLLLLVAGRTLMAQSTASADKILGTFYMDSPLSDDHAKVKITKASNGTYQGRIVWLDKPTNPDGSPRTDEKNPDPKLRSRTATQITLVWGLKFEDGEWVKGTVYDPFSGKKFGVKMSLAKNGSDLSVRYYKGTPAAGITRTWKRQ